VNIHVNGACLIFYYCDIIAISSIIPRLEFPETGFQIKSINTIVSIRLDADKLTLFEDNNESGTLKNSKDCAAG
jgi:hypothetical protein